MERGWNELSAQTHQVFLGDPWVGSKSNLAPSTAATQQALSHVMVALALKRPTELRLGKAGLESPSIPWPCIWDLNQKSNTKATHGVPFGLRGPTQGTVSSQHGHI